MDCTILIYTLDRPAYVARQVSYLKAVLPQYRVMVGDGSTGSFAAENAAAVQASGHSLAEYRPYPGVSPAPRLLNLLREVDTPLVVICADDDFLIPEGFLASIEIMTKDRSLAVCQGASIGMPGPSENGMAHWGFNCKIGDIVCADPAERVAHHLNPYAHTFYGVHRTPSMLEIIGRISAPPFTLALGCTGELAQSVLTAASGGLRWLPIPYLCREPSLRRWPFELEVVHPDFSAAIDAVRSFLVERCTQPGQPANMLAGKLFDHSAANYFMRFVPGLESKQFDFWNWKSSRTPWNQDHSLDRMLHLLWSSSAWPMLLKHYPLAITESPKPSKKWGFGRLFK